MCTLRVLLFYEIVYTVKIYCKLSVIVRCHGLSFGCIVQNVRHPEANKKTKLLIAVFGHIMFELFERFGTLCSNSDIGRLSTPELTADKANNKRVINFISVKYEDLVH